MATVKVDKYKHVMSAEKALMVVVSSVVCSWC
jgi:hypothetical protein